MISFRRVAAGDYETADGRFRLWRIPDVYPPAWNVEDTSTDDLIVNGAATKRDALALSDPLPAHTKGNPPA